MDTRRDVRFGFYLILAGGLSWLVGHILRGPLTELFSYLFGSLQSFPMEVLAADEILVGMGPWFVAAGAVIVLLSGAAGEIHRRSPGTRLEREMLLSDPEVPPPLIGGWPRLPDA